ncbi:MAG: hypothetical protein COA38_10355 [Fluviicola sp.]|nr:MAG: hypothetical protein COA38_10355 [Fluviicola sp.]
MKLTIISFFVMSFASITISQSETDSLWGVWNNQNAPELNRIKAIEHLAWFEYVQSNPDSAFLLSEYQYELASKIRNNRYMGNARNTQAVSLYNRGKFDSAIIYNNLALSIYQRGNLEKGVANSFNNLGLNYNAKGYEKRAVESYQRSIKIMRKIDDQLGIARGLNNIGIIHRSSGEYELAIKSFEESLKIKQEERDTLATASSLNNLGLVHKSKMEFDKALYYFNRSSELERKFNDLHSLAGSYGNIGNIFLLKGDLTKALEYHGYSLKLRRKLDDSEGIANTLHSLSKVYQEKREFERAEKLGTEAFEIAKRINSIFNLYDVAWTLYEIKKAQGKFEEALEMYVLYNKYKAQLERKEVHRAAVKSFYQIDFEKKMIVDSLKDAQEQRTMQLQIKEEQVRANQEKMIGRILLVGLSFLVIWIAVLVYQLRFIRKQKRVIELQTVEREKMIQEIHHRVKNNLQIVKSMIGLQLYRVKDSELISILEECQGRILTMAKIHETLYGLDQFTSVNVKSYFVDLLKDILSSYRLHKDITLKIDVADFRMGMRTLVPLALIVNEIATNSCKYAFETIDSPSLLFGLKRLESGLFQLNIGDNGIGEMGDNLQNEDSLGSELIEVFTEQLEGEIEKKNENGLIYTLTFQDQDIDEQQNSSLRYESN